jgi:hypothetical protein
MREGPTHDLVKAQLHSASGRSPKVIKDREGIEAVVEVPGAGRLVLRVDSGGGYSLRGRPEGDEADEAASRDLIGIGARFFGSPAISMTRIPTLHGHRLAATVFSVTPNVRGSALHADRRDSPFR